MGTVTGIGQKTISKISISETPFTSFSPLTFTIFLGPIIGAAAAAVVVGGRALVIAAGVMWLYKKVSIDSNVLTLLGVKVYLRSLAHGSSVIT